MNKKQRYTVAFMVVLWCVVVALVTDTPGTFMLGVLMGIIADMVYDAFDAVYTEVNKSDTP